MPLPSLQFLNNRDAEGMVLSHSVVIVQHVHSHTGGPSVYKTSEWSMPQNQKKTIALAKMRRAKKRHKLVSRSNSSTIIFDTTMIISRFKQLGGIMLKASKLVSSLSWTPAAVGRNFSSSSPQDWVTTEETDDPAIAILKMNRSPANTLSLEM